MGSGGYRHEFADQVALGDADDGVALLKVDAAVGTNRTSALGRIEGESTCVSVPSTGSEPAATRAAPASVAASQSAHRLSIASSSTP